VATDLFISFYRLVHSLVVRSSSRRHDGRRLDVRRRLDQNVFFFVDTRRNGRYKMEKKNVDLGYEKRRLATMNFGVAKKVILGKYHLAFHSKKNMCRKKSRVV
jgi:hypothetical protein